jgi:hypothetical protein
MSTPQNLKETKEALDRMQKFECKSLARIEDLGREMNFSLAVEPAERLVELYKRVPVSILDDLTDEQLNQIKGLSQADFNIINEILTFTPTRGDAAAHRNNLMTTLQKRRDQTFGGLWQFVAYGLARVTDTGVLETEARAMMQEIKDRSTELEKKLLADKVAAENALAAIRAVAAEQGVSQEAEHFKREADQQEDSAASWLFRAYCFASAVVGFAILSIFLHKIPWIAPNSIQESIQLFGSKILIFSTLLYLLILAARNYSSNKHNAVVNRHRQNALLTYKALTTAAAEGSSADIILANAAACIYSPQETGYSSAAKDGGGSTTPRSVLELFTKASTKDAGTS